MEFIEKHDLTKIHYLNSLTFKQFKEYCSSGKNDEERKIMFNTLKEFCKTNIKTRGQTKRIYSYSLQTPLESGGRLYCGNSIQGIKSVFRGFLMDNTTDMDMKNAHPVILAYICSKHSIRCPELKNYIENRDEILAEFSDKDKGKIAFLKAVNDDKHNAKISNKTFKAFDKEMKEIQGKIVNLECYKDIKNSVPDQKKYNWNGSAINRILCMYENKILQSAISALNQRGIEICALMFDGVMPYGDFYGNEELLAHVTEYVEKDFEGLNMIWAYKPHDNTIKLPDDFEVPEEKSKEESKEIAFQEKAKKFELTHAKIIDQEMYVKDEGNKITCMTKKHLIMAYENEVFEYKVDGKIERNNFIKNWTVNNPTQRTYTNMGIYPNPLLCPPNIFNMWKPFDMELITKWEDRPKELQFILNHIRILCGNSEDVSDYFTKWIAQIIQFPEVKTMCPTFISKEGAGKTSLIILLEKMLGSSKVYETTNPMRDVWGDFNGRMINTFLVNLNELSKKDTIECQGRIKGLITDGKITINNKGKNQYDIQSYHRFIITTNNEDPITTKQDDRRNLVIRCSDELIGNKEYFNKLYSYFDDVNVVKTFYEYLKRIPDMGKFGSIIAPITEYQNDLKDMNMDVEERWLREMVSERDEDFKLLGSEMINLFSDFCANNKIEYKTNSKKLGLKIKRIVSDCISKEHTNKGERTTFCVENIRKKLDIGCLVKI
jgi:hypothetical protein